MQQNKFKTALEKLTSLPIVYWALPIFLLAYFMFFLSPVFLNADRTMKFFTYVPARDVIGQDLNYILSYCTAWFVDGSSPYIGHNLYPPFTILFFGPLLWVTPATAFIIISTLIVLGYIFLTFGFPLLISRNQDMFSLAVLFLTTGLFSYGLQFELEKGQFNVIAMSCCMAGIYLYHFQPKWRYLAYALFIISVQLKVYPAIFMLLFIHDWRDWKGNIIRISGIAAANFLLFFILGYQIFLDFIQAIKAQALYPYLVMNNLSTTAFTELLFRKNGYRNYFLTHGMDLERLLALSKYSTLLQNLLFTLIGLCLAFAMIRAYKLRLSGIDPYLLLVCTISALLIPSVSHDYKLAITAGPIMLALQESPSIKRYFWLRLLALLCTWIILFAYATTIFSYTNKPFLLWNNFPMLMLILISVTFKTLLPNSPSDTLAE